MLRSIKVAERDWRVSIYFLNCFIAKNTYVIKKGIMDGIDNITPQNF